MYCTDASVFSFYVFFKFVIFFYRNGAPDQNIGVVLVSNIVSILPCGYSVGGNLRVNSPTQPLLPGILVS